MNTMLQHWEGASSASVMAEEAQNWYALSTRARHEKIVAQRLDQVGITTFLPLFTEVRHWSDRRKLVEFPLFGGYVFAKLSPTAGGRLKALRINGVSSLLGARGEGTPIPDEQIATVRRLLEERLGWHAHPFLKVGQRVRICNGVLRGIEGILVSRRGTSTLVVSVDVIHRSVAFSIEGYDIEPA